MKENLIKFSDVTEHVIDIVSKSDDLNAQWIDYLKNYLSIYKSFYMIPNDCVEFYENEIKKLEADLEYYIEMYKETNEEIDRIIDICVNG